ncbi:beta-propeller fold lactonase family protein [Kitasatospora sp. RG8]|uniref:lactonase family protein n=1 Tax=Kitasatospora sp. RG8 TaxID=2820815 RepID=UPI001ADF1528|nr:beta-propeller fold lactonase family protein [Kitasatospora sp. RG8]MBP0452651.1 beta-propeller fold lactonase family protein [Kitasatospora sp. RG8]
MQKITRLAVAVATALAAAAAVAPSTAAAYGGEGHPRGGHHAVFVQTDNPAGNQVIAYRRADDGQLSPAGTYDTNGLGDVLAGSVADHLASQGSLTYDPRHALLYAVNAGSDTVSVFSVDGDRLALRQVVGSGGRFPVSVAVHDDTVYVLNALDGGSIQGYTVRGGRLHEEADWNRCLGLDPNATPQFTNTPGQVGFTGEGSQLVVTTKANGSSLQVFNLDRSGAPGATAVTTSLPGAVPFAFVPNGRHGLFLAEAGTNAVATFTIHHDGTATQEAFAATGQAATCWIVGVRDLLYASNAGSSTLTGLRTADRGRQLTVLGNTPTDPGTVDAAVSSNGRYLYAQTGVNGILDEFAINDDGSLTPIGSQTVPGGAGGEGIVAF